MGTIGTHNGVFHCDEVLACVMLQKLEEFKNHKILRSRDETVLAECDIVVDVGGIHDHPKRRYDHHQKGFEETMRTLNPDMPYDIKLSSAGLVYSYYGERILNAMTSIPMHDDKFKELYKKIYTNLIMEVDAIDNGVNQTVEKPKYRINTTLSDRVAKFNVAWNETDVDETERFYQAYDMVDKEFIQIVNGFANVWLPAYRVVKEAFDSRLQCHASGCVLKLSQHCPWTDHLLAIEEAELGACSADQGSGSLDSYRNRPLFVIYERKDGTWSCQAVPISLEQKFVSRLRLPEAWGGLRQAELDAVTNISGGVFVHSTGFLGIHKTYDGVMKMIEHTLKSASIS